MEKEREDKRITINHGNIVGNNISEWDIEMHEGNRNLALFLGAEVYNNHACIVDHFTDKEGVFKNKYVMGICYFPDERIEPVLVGHLKYHKSWNELMPIVAKISEYRLAHPDEANKVCDAKVVIGIEYLWRLCVGFAKFYNSIYNKEDE